MRTASRGGPFWRDRLLYFALAVSIILHFDTFMLFDAILGAAPSGVVHARRAPPNANLKATLKANSPAPDPPAASTTEVQQSVAPQPAPEENPPPEPAKDALALMPPVAQAQSPAASEVPAAADPAEPRYFTPGELSRRPRLLSFVEINANADPAPSAPGRARFRILINERGGVDQVAIDDSDLPPVFEQATKDAFLKAEYVPGEINGVPVRSQIRIEVSYDGPVEPEAPLK